MSQPEPTTPPSVQQAPHTGRVLLVLLALVLVGTACAWWVLRRQSPEAQTRRLLAEADKLVEDGELEEAAKKYRDLADGPGEQGKQAVERFRKLLGKPLDNAPLAKAVGVLSVAASLPETRDGLVNRAQELLRARGQQEPHEALALFDLLAYFVQSEKEFTELFSQRAELLRKAIQADPSDIELVSEYAKWLASPPRSDAVAVSRLLGPLRDRLGDSDGAFLLAHTDVLGGKNDAALALIAPYCKKRLPQMLAADRKFQDVRKQVVEVVEKEIASETADRFDFERYQAASKEVKQALTGEYVVARLRGNLEFQQANAELQRQQYVPRAMLMLGQLHTTKARDLPDPAARKAELAKARQAFVSLRDTIADQPDVRIGQAQVAYWMGEPKEGERVLEELLAKTQRLPNHLVNVSNALRSVGDFTGARKLLEEAHEKEKNSQAKQEVALQRSRLAVNVADEIAWLQKSDRNLPITQVQLGRALARQAEDLGKTQEAAGHIRKAIDALAKLPESPGTLNEGGLGWLELFRLTGDKPALDKGTAMLSKAVEQQPANYLAINNAASAISQAAWYDLVADAIDPAVLRPRASPSHLGFLYADREGRERQADRVRKHAGLIAARSLAEKLLTLQPRQSGAYELLTTILAWNRDEKGLKDLEARLRAVELDQADEIKHRLETYAGKHDEQYRQDRKTAMERWEKLTDEMRKNKPGRTFAVAATGLVRALIGGEMLGETIDAERAVRLADEARAACDCRATGTVLVSALLYRAHQQLKEREPEYRRLAERGRRSLDAAHLLAIALSRDGKARTAALAHDDVKRACQLIREQAAAFPDEPGLWHYTMLQATHPDAAAKIAEALRKDELTRAFRALTFKLKPASLPDALEQFWELKLNGKEKEGLALLKRLGDQGVPLP